MGNLPNVDKYPKIAFRCGLTFSCMICADFMYVVVQSPESLNKPGSCFCLTKPAQILPCVTC
jgi:hypothetical protein